MVMRYPNVRDVTSNVRSLAFAGDDGWSIVGTLAI